MIFCMHFYFPLGFQPDFKLNEQIAEISDQFIKRARHCFSIMINTLKPKIIKRSGEDLK